MKILSLRLSNLASIAGEHEVHFEQEPLKNSGLIAITGVTGAGKTTLLDAICLALFDQVPRLQHGENNKKLTDASGDDIAVSSTLNILRRGCVQGYAEVEFIAQDNKHYLARWEVKRARLKPDGRIQPVLRVLRCLSDSQLISERTKECNEQIVKLLGLTFEQFTRAVLLAQSEVTAFLKAKDGERADLLEYLTNSDIYSRIGMASFAATKQAREKVEVIEKSIGDQQPLTTEQREQLTAQLASTQQEIEQHRATQQQLVKHIDWYQQQAALQQQIDQQKTQLERAQQALTDFQPSLLQLEQLAQLEPVRECFIQQQQCHERLSDYQQQQQQAQQQNQQLEQKLAQQQAHCQQQSELLNHKTQNFHQIRPQLQQAQHFELQLKNLAEHNQTQQNKLIQLSQQLAPQLSRQQQLQQQEYELQDQQQLLRHTLNQQQDFACFDAEPQAAIHGLQKAASLRQQLLQQQPDIFTEDLAGQQAQLVTLKSQLAQLVQQHTSLVELEQKLLGIQQQIEVQQRHLLLCQRIEDQLKIWLKIEQQHHEQQQQEVTLRQQLNTLQPTLEQAIQQCQTAEIQFKTTQQLLHEQRLLSAKSVQELRQQLQPAHPCMVCGSTTHPFYDPQHLLNALDQQVDMQLQQAEQTLQQARQQVQALQQQVGRLQVQIEQLHNTQQQLAQDRQLLFAELQCISKRFYSLIEPNMTSDFARYTLQQGRVDLENKKATLEQDYLQQYNLIKQWQNVEKQLERHSQLLEKRQQLIELEQQYIDPLPQQQVQAWQQHNSQASATFIAAIKARCTAFEQLKQLDSQCQQFNIELGQLALSINHQQQQQAELKQDFQDQQAQQHKVRQQLGELLQQYAAPLQVQDSQDWQQQLEQQIDYLKQQLEQANQNKQDTEKQQIKVQQQLAHHQQEIQKIQHNLQQLNQHISQWQLQYPAILPEHIRDLLAVSHAQKQQLQARLHELQQHYQQAQNTLNVYQQQWQQHQVSQPELELAHLQQQLPALKQRLQQLDEACTVFKLQKLQDEQQQKQAAHFLLELEKAKAEHHRWDKISSLIGDAKGATFKKLAQQFHLQMLVELANQQLSDLTPRYSLRCLEDSLGLTIVDHYMNDEVRPVLSLSGGESFLVSLALALGIANMASGTTKLESLFIDEGFGTLDQSSLHIVMDALDRLQSQGRKVILISHITEMHERIPVKIQVIPQGSGASKIEVVG